MANALVTYNIPGKANRPDIDDQLLEETGFDSLGADFEDLTREGDISLSDIDNDGLREMLVTDFQRIKRDFSSENSFPSMTTFFDDSDSSIFYDFNSIADQSLKTSIIQGQVKDWFTKMADKNTESPLKSVAEALATYLNATAIHSGVDVDDSIDISTNPDDINNFSLTLDGRRRVDCVIFSELAVTALKGIPGTTIFTVGMESNERGLESGYGSYVGGMRTLSPLSFETATPPKNQKAVAEKKQTFSFARPGTPSVRFSGHQIAVIYHAESKSLLIVDNASVTFIPNVKNMKETVQSPYASYQGFTWRPA